MIVQLWSFNTSLYKSQRILFPSCVCETSCASGWGSTWGFHCSLVGYLFNVSTEGFLTMKPVWSLQHPTVHCKGLQKAWCTRVDSAGHPKGTPAWPWWKFSNKNQRDFLMPQWGKKQFELERLQQKSIRFRHRIEGPHNEDDVLPLFGVWSEKMRSKCSWLLALLAQLHGSAPDGVWKVQRKVTWPHNSLLSYGHVEIKLIKLQRSKLAHGSTRLLQ